jgi:hypothetical protein
VGSRKPYTHAPASWSTGSGDGQFAHHAPASAGSFVCDPLPLHRSCEIASGHLGRLADSGRRIGSSKRLISVAAKLATSNGPARRSRSAAAPRRPFQNFRQHVGADHPEAGEEPDMGVDPQNHQCRQQPQPSTPGGVVLPEHAEKVGGQYRCEQIAARRYRANEAECALSILTRLRQPRWGNLFVGQNLENVARR